MSHQQLAQAAAAPSLPERSAKPEATRSYREALRILGRAYTEGRPLALIASEGQCGANYLLRHFLSSVNGDVTVVRIQEPVEDEISLMRAIIRGIGFEPSELNLADLENVFQLFLSFQQRHNYRTILCVDETHDYGRWILNAIHRVLQLQPEDGKGLLILMSGQPIVDETLNQSLLDAICTEPEHFISLAPFTLAETRDYLRWRARLAGMAEIADVFEFDAITHVFELTQGSTDKVSTLFLECVELATNENSGPVTVALVDRASALLATPDDTQPCVDQLESSAEKADTPAGRLLVRNGEGTVREYWLDRGHVLIGRGKLCDVRIADPSVSRHHALVINSPDGAMLVDLESTNGTFVDGKRIKEHALQQSGVITMGECNVDFVGDAGIQGWILDVYDSDKGEVSNAEFVTQEVETWNRTEVEKAPEATDGRTIKGNINNKGEKIYHVPGTSKYNATIIDESKGERWFRSEDEAKAAGWRASRV